MKQPFYVIGVYGDPWVLTPEGYTLIAARRAVAWQGGNSDDWRICTYDGEKRCFVDQARVEYHPQRGAYTEEAWERYSSEIHAEWERRIGQ